MSMHLLLHNQTGLQSGGDDAVPSSEMKMLSWWDSFLVLLFQPYFLHSVGTSTPGAGSVGPGRISLIIPLISKPLSLQPDHCFG